MWRDKPRENEHFTFGHCYLATEALYHLWGKYKGFKPKCLSSRTYAYGHIEEHYTHWYLEHPVTHVIVDPTKEQWKGKRIPYEGGVGNGLINDTLGPSKRCRILIRRIR